MSEGDLAAASLGFPDARIYPHVDFATLRSAMHRTRAVCNVYATARTQSVKMRVSACRHSCEINSW